MLQPVGSGGDAVPWASDVIPGWTRSAHGALTLSGSPAVFRSSPHYWFALRLVYLAEVAGVPADVIAEKDRSYRRAWDRFVRHGTELQLLATLIDADRDAAASVWNALDQPDIDAAFSTVICEREPWPRVNVATLALRHYGLEPAVSVTHDLRDRKLTKLDNQTAWSASDGGICRGCATATISQRQHDQIRKVLAAHPDQFDLSPTYQQTNGRSVPVWSNRILIAAKGVADHVIPRSFGGATAPDNLANVCAACNYTRSNISLDAARVTAYT